MNFKEEGFSKKRETSLKNHTAEYESDTRSVQRGKRGGGIAVGLCESLEADRDKGNGEFHKCITIAHH